MRILYLSCHSILEFDEVKLFTELGHEVFSLGSYINPTTPHDPKRPPISAPADEYLLNVALQSSKENLHEKLIEWADIIYIMHKPEWVLNNWEKIKHKTVVWRTIGQSTPTIEAQMLLPYLSGMKIVRYSKGEDKIKDFAGSTKLIRFYKDPDEFKGYTGEIPAILNITQSMKERNRFCLYDVFDEATKGFERNLYGTPSRNPDHSLMEDPIWKGELDYEGLKQAYRANRAYFYTGTYPASYVLNFVESFMTGIPVIAVGRTFANLGIFDMDAYEVDEIIENGVDGYIGNSIEELRSYVELLLNNPETAKKIGEAGRKKAIELFGKETIKKQWEEFFKSC